MLGQFGKSAATLGVEADLQAIGHG